MVGSAIEEPKRKQSWADADDEDDMDGEHELVTGATVGDDSYRGPPLAVLEDSRGGLNKQFSNANVDGLGAGAKDFSFLMAGTKTGKNENDENDGSVTAGSMSATAESKVSPEDATASSTGDDALWEPNPGAKEFIPTLSMQCPLVAVVGSGAPAAASPGGEEAWPALSPAPSPSMRPRSAPQGSPKSLAKGGPASPCMRPGNTPKGSPALPPSFAKGHVDTLGSQPALLPPSSCEAARGRLDSTGSMVSTGSMPWQSSDEVAPGDKPRQKRRANRGGVAVRKRRQSEDGEKDTCDGAGEAIEEAGSENVPKRSKSEERDDGAPAPVGAS